VNTTLDLLRHGEPVGGRKYRGQIDDPLSEKGWAQMRDTVGDAAPWTRVVSSPMARCRYFAESLAERHALPLFFDSRLKEVGFGEWEGLAAADIEARWPGALERFKRDPVAARPTGAEPLEDFRARVGATLDELTATCPGEHLLLVGHAGVVRMALAWTLQLSLGNAYRIEVASASLTRLHIDSGRVSLIFHGNTRLPA
jgi:alpha-ribazole phosphatase/probable phosphoglycerate mutase